nr:chordin-like [Penaeus vannamei]
MRWGSANGSGVGTSARGGAGLAWAWRVSAVLALLLALVVVADATPLGDGRRGGRNGASGGGRDAGSSVRIVPKHEWKRRFRKSSECRLGRNRFDLHQVWSPNLGPPFGVWSCVKCECVPVSTKRILHFPSEGRHDNERSEGHGQPPSRLSECCRYRWRHVTVSVTATSVTEHQA